MLSVKNTIDRLGLINKGGVYGCAVSGGGDSMALLDFLLSLREEYGFKLICVNLEHGIRGEESRADSAFVKDFCQRRGIEFKGQSADVPAYAKKNGMNLEQAARELRYRYFYSLINEGICDKIFTAHNKKDNAETVLLNIFRGSGSKGLCGIPLISEDGKIIRPMLYTDKAEINEYIAKHDIAYRTDSTNFDNSYSRNFIRNEILPLLEKKFSGLYDNITRLCGIMSEENEFIDKISEERIEYGEKSCCIRLPCDSVLIKHAAMLCCRHLGVYADITSANLNDIAALAVKQNGKLININGGINAYKEYDKILIEKASRIDPFPKEETPFETGEFVLGGYKIIAALCGREEFENRKGRRALYADYAKFGPGCVFRFRREGDVFKRYKGGTKSLSDYLTDIRAPKRLRNGLPLICRGSTVLAVFPYDISDDVKVDGETQNIIKLSYERIKL
jgi:tRNA(Ile)-lysidine synthase